MDLGLFQRDVAKEVGADTTSVWNWETGGREPEIKHLPAIIAFLGYDPRPKPENQSIGQKLVAYRLGFGWSQKRLAVELAVDPTTLSRWERGVKIPWGPYVQRVNRVLGRTSGVTAEAQG